MKLLVDIKDYKYKDEVPLECTNCHTTFLRKKSEIMKALSNHPTITCQYCSRKCAGNSRRESSLDKSCENCNKSFTAKDSRQRFCSRTCSASQNNKIYPKRKAKHGECLQCASSITGSSTFCSPVCYQTYRKENTFKLEGHSTTRYRRNLKTRAVELKGGKCVRCGYNKCIAALQFHHLDPSKKEFNISSYTGSWDKVKEELEKCILICSNCHFEEHSTR